MDLPFTLSRYLDTLPGTEMTPRQRACLENLHKAAQGFIQALDGHVPNDPLARRSLEQFEQVVMSLEGVIRYGVGCLTGSRLADAFAEVEARNERVVRVYGNPRTLHDAHALRDLFTPLGASHEIRGAMGHIWGALLVQRTMMPMGCIVLIGEGAQDRDLQEGWRPSDETYFWL